MTIVRLVAGGGCYLTVACLARWLRRNLPITGLITGRLRRSSLPIARLIALWLRVLAISRRVLRRQSLVVLRLRCDLSVSRLTVGRLLRTLAIS